MVTFPRDSIISSKSLFSSKTTKALKFIIDFCIGMLQSSALKDRGCHGRDRMVVGFTTTYSIGAYHH